MDPESIREEGLTTDDVMNREFVEPQTDVEMLPEWEEFPEERPGENLRIEENVLIWERDGFEARLESYETTHWKAHITIPKEIGKWQPRPIDLKCKSYPEYGYVEDVETEDYSAVGATIILQDNFQPTWEVNHFIDKLIEEAEGGAEYEKEVEEMLAAARENEPGDEESE